MPTSIILEKQKDILSPLEICLGTTYKSNFPYDDVPANTSPPDVRTYIEIGSDSDNIILSTGKTKNSIRIIGKGVESFKDILDALDNIYETLRQHAEAEREVVTID